MLAATSLIVLSSLLACQGKLPDPPSAVDSAAGQQTGGTDGAAGGDSAGDTAADTADDAATGDSDEPGDTAPDEVVISEVGWSLDEDVASVVRVSWQQSGAAESWVEFQLEGEGWQSSPPQPREAGAQEALVLGVPFDADVTLRVALADGASSEPLTARTGPLPEGLSQPELLSAEAEGWYAEGRWLLLNTSSGAGPSEVSWKLVLDRAGRVVWALATPEPYGADNLQPSLSGAELLWDQQDAEMVGREYEIDLEGQVLREVWSCGAGSGIEARYRGEAHRLPNGNTTLNYGPGSRFREYTADCEVVWDLSWPDQSVLLKGTFLEDLYRFAP